MIPAGQRAGVHGLLEPSSPEDSASEPSFLTQQTANHSILSGHNNNHLWVMGSLPFIHFLLLGHKMGEPYPDLTWLM